MVVAGQASPEHVFEYKKKQLIQRAANLGPQGQHEADAPRDVGAP